MALEIGDKAVPKSDVQVLNATYRTGGIEGLVLNRKLITINSENQDIFTYQVSFPSPITGTTTSGTEADVQSLFWFSSEELGQEGILIEEYDYNKINSDLNNARSTSAQALSIVGSIENEVVPTDLFSESIYTIAKSVQENNNTLAEASFNSNDSKVREQEASKVGFDSLGLEVNQAVLQEIAENMSNFNSLQSQTQAEIDRQGQQTAEQVKLYNTSKEEDHLAYTEALVETGQRLPQGSIYKLRTTDWETALTPPLTVNITPEVE
jgi:hypothetical protein